MLKVESAVIKWPAPCDEGALIMFVSKTRCFLAVMTASVCGLSACAQNPSHNFRLPVHAAYYAPAGQLREARLSRDLIDVGQCTKGLSGNLDTGLSGRALLVEHGLASTPSALRPPLALVDPRELEAAPSAVGSLKVKSGLTERLLTAGYELTGRPYRVGGQEPAAGFDAAGFTKWIYGRAGLNLNRDLKRQAAGARQVAKEDLRPGDLLVYRMPRDGYHLGVYSGQGNFLHASPQTRVITETAAFGPQFGPYFVGGRRYYDDPKAAPLSDAQKMAATSAAVKVALAQLSPDAKPAAYAKPAKKAVKARASQRRVAKATKKIAKKSSKKSRR